MKRTHPIPIVRCRTAKWKASWTRSKRTRRAASTRVCVKRLRLRWPRAAAHAHHEFRFTPFAHELEPRILTRFEGGDQLEHGVGARDRPPIHPDQYVTRFDAGLVGGTAAYYLGDERAPRIGQFERLCDRAGHVLRSDADPAARDTTAADDLFQDVLCHAGGDRKPDADAAARAGVDR